MSERRNVCETEASNGVRQQGGRDRENGQDRETTSEREKMRETKSTSEREGQRVCVRERPPV